MSKKSSRALLNSIYETDCAVLESDLISYEDTKRLYIDESDQEIKVKPNKKKKRVEIVPIHQEKEDPHSFFNKGTISKRLVSCACNKCKEPVNGTMISYIHLSASNKSIPFIQYSCDNCGHAGYRSVQTKALPAEEFDRFYFS